MGKKKRKSRLAMMPFWTGDYLSSTRSMTLAERGAYTDLLFFSWENGGLPADMHRQSRMLGITLDEFREVLPVIRPHFYTDPETGLVFNARLEEERQFSIELREDAKLRGINGGRKTRERWQTDREGMKAKAASKAPSHALSEAPSPLKGRLRAVPHASIKPRLKQEPPSPSPSSSPSEAQRERNSEAESDAHTHFGPNGTGK